jgi:hypothetical protein
VERRVALLPACLPARAQPRHVHSTDLRDLRLALGEGCRPEPRPYSERRHSSSSSSWTEPHGTTSETFDDGRALFAAVCELGYEGVVAKERSSRYGSTQRGWVKVKNKQYWRRDSEIEAMHRSFERRTRRFAASPRGK